ncbi:hypothetical protein [Asaia astilbis]|uniref:hypothetical protein n=1 Tax=Asaia astilbis TaxID=610244 RepID=UPI0012EC4F45|nr:hypothetical protein [Asaia astilbis]
MTRHFLSLFLASLVLAGCNDTRDLAPQSPDQPGIRRHRPGFLFRQRCVSPARRHPDRTRRE